MYSYDIREVANAGGYNKFKNVSITYGLAQVGVFFHESERPDSVPLSDWEGLRKKYLSEVEVSEGEDDGGVYLDEVDFTVHIHMGECEVCQGKGKYVNPSIDAGGLTYEDFANDPEFEEEYFRGAYDQVCEACGGKGKYPEIDRDKTPEWIVNLIDEREEEERREAYSDRYTYMREMGYCW